MAKTLLMVYGTLKQGGCNSRLMGNSKFIGTAVVAPGTTLYTNGAYPMMVECAEDAEGTGVEGEIYEVDEQTLATLDRFEGHPRHFKRTPIKLDHVALVGDVATLSEAVQGTVYAYMYQLSVNHLSHLGTHFPVKG